MARTVGSAGSLSTVVMAPVEATLGAVAGTTTDKVVGLLRKASCVVVGVAARALAKPPHDDSDLDEDDDDDDDDRDNRFAFAVAKLPKSKRSSSEPAWWSPTSTFASLDAAEHASMSPPPPPIRPATLPASTPRLRAIVSDSAKATNFREFLQRAHSEECLDFLAETAAWSQSFADVPDLPRAERAAWAKRIIDTFVEDGAPHQVNVSAETTESMRRRSVELDPNAFEDARADLAYLLEHDAVTRFVHDVPPEI